MTKFFNSVGMPTFYTKKMVPLLHLILFLVQLLDICKI